MTNNAIIQKEENTLSTEVKATSISDIVSRFSNLNPTALKNKLETEKQKNLLINEVLYTEVVLAETSRDLDDINKDIERITREVNELTFRKDAAAGYAIIGRGINPLAEDTYNKLLKAINDKEAILMKAKTHKEAIMNRLGSAGNPNSGVNVNVANITTPQDYRPTPPPPPVAAHQGIGDVDIFDL